jgi:hypothetical protein
MSNYFDCQVKLVLSVHQDREHPVDIKAAKAKLAKY